MGNGRKRLGELLVEWGLLSEADLDKALEWQREDGRRLGVILIERGLINATKITQILSHQFNLPFVSLQRVKFTAELVAAVPVRLARSRRLVPICFSGEDVLFLATDDPSDELLAQEASVACRKEVRLMVASPHEVERVLETYFQAVPSAPAPRLPLPPPRSIAIREPMGAVRVAVSERPPAASIATGETVRISPIRTPDPEIVELSEDDLLSASEPPAQRPPVVMLIRASEFFASQCTRAANALGMRLEHANLINAVELANELKPIALVLMEDIFAMDRIGFTKLSIQVSAHLVIWSDALGIEYLEPLLAAAKQNASSAGLGPP